MNSDLDFVDGNGLLRTVFHAGQAVDAFGHVDRIRLAAVNFEYGLRAHIHAGSVAVALALVDCYHVHDALFLLQ